MSEKLVITINASTPEQGTKAEQRKDGRAAGPKDVVVYHWGRIGSALVVLVVLLMLGIWKLTEHQDSRVSVTSPSSSTTPSGIESPATVATGQSASATVAPKPAPAPASVSKPVEAPTNTPPPSPRSDGSASAKPAAPATPADNLPTTESAPTMSKAAKTELAQPASPDNAPKVSTSEIPAKVRILSHHVARAQLTSQLKNRLPTDRLDAVIPLNGRDLIKVYFYTELKGLKHRRVYHRWYHDGKAVARIAIRPYLDDMNASSSKYITPRMTGHWRVLVSDDQGHELSEVNFDVR